MNKEQRLEGNKLIATFMNRNFSTSCALDYKGNIPDSLAKTLRYHSSWDWLMPVVKRIMESYFAEREDIFTGIMSVDIDQTFKAVVKFIEFWNDPEQPKMIWKTTPLWVKNYFKKDKHKIKTT